MTEDLETIAEQSPMPPSEVPPVPPTPTAPDLEQTVEKHKPTTMDGVKLGIAYYVDPLGRMWENWENVAVDGRPLRENYSQTLFEQLSENAHKGNSFAKYFGAALGIGAGAATLAVATIPYATMAMVTLGYDIYKTFSNPRDVPDGEYDPTLWDGFKGGLGIGVDPVGFFLENIERNVIDGEGIDDNRIKSVTEQATKDARQGNSVRKYVGGTLGLGTGAFISYATLGLVPVATGCYDIVASIRNKPRT